MTIEYPNSGALFRAKSKKNEKSPDMNGDIKFDPEYLRELLRNADGLVTVKIDAWKRESAAGNSFLSLKVNTWKPTQKPQEKMPFDD